MLNRTDIMNFKHETPLSYPYTTETISPHVVLVPILRSGLGMLEGKYSSYQVVMPRSNGGHFSKLSKHFFQTQSQFITLGSSVNPLHSRQ